MAEQLIRASESEFFTDLLALSGLRPMKDLRYSDWSQADFSGCDGVVLDVTGANLMGAKLGPLFLGTNISRWTMISAAQHRARTVTNLRFQHTYLHLPLALAIQSRLVNRDYGELTDFCDLRMTRPTIRNQREGRCLGITVLKPDDTRIEISAVQSKNAPNVKFAATRRVQDGAMLLARRLLHEVPPRNGSLPWHIPHGQTFAIGDKSPLMRATYLHESVLGPISEPLLHSASPISRADFSYMMETSSTPTARSESVETQLTRAASAEAYLRHLELFTDTRCRLPSIPELGCIIGQLPNPDAMSWPMWAALFDARGDHLQTIAVVPDGAPVVSHASERQEITIRSKKYWVERRPQGMAPARKALGAFFVVLRPR